MKKLKLALAIIIAISFSSVYMTAADKAEIDKKAPQFSLTDSKGKTHNLANYAGKYVILEWINFDCPFVKKFYDADDMQRLQEKYADMGVVWLSICSSALGKQGHFGNDEINKHIADHKAKMKAYLIDEDGKVGKMYNAKTTPHMYIINPDGILIYAGAIDSIKSTESSDIKKAENYIVSALEQAMNGKPVKTKTSVPYGCSVKY